MLTTEKRHLIIGLYMSTSLKLDLISDLKSQYCHLVQTLTVIPVTLCCSSLFNVSLTVSLLPPCKAMLHPFLYQRAGAAWPWPHLLSDGRISKLLWVWAADGPQSSSSRELSMANRITEMPCWRAVVLWLDDSRPQGPSLSTQGETSLWCSSYSRAPWRSG